MMLYTSIILGIVQGLTEFLPISSSGHLVLFQNFFGLREPELLFDSTLHLGTLVAVCIFFRSDLQQMLFQTWNFAGDVMKGRKKVSEINGSPSTSLALWVFMGSIPTAVIGLLFRSHLEGLFCSVKAVGFMLIGTGTILAVTRLIPAEYNGRKRVGLWRALAVGGAQGLALIPGISRSGTTIACGILCGVDRELAARYSFLLSIPAIIGALLLQSSAEGFNRVGLRALVAGFVLSTLVGLAALKILMSVVKKGNLAYFAPYCWLLGIAIVLYSS